MTAFGIDLVFPRFKLLSGAERAILGLAGALTDAGHRIRVVCHQFDRSCDVRLPTHVELVCGQARLDWTSNRYLNAVSDYVRTLSLRRFLDRRADLYVLFGPSLPLVGSLRGLTRGTPPVLYYCWEPPRVLYQDREAVLERVGWARPLLGPALTAYTRVDRFLVQWADAVCTSSPFAAARIHQAYGRRASVITLGVDRPRLDAVSSIPRAVPPRVLTVNSLHPRKRVDLILEAAARCRARWTDPETRPTWVVVGDGPERARLETMVETLGLTRDVRFTGFVSDDDLPKYYAAASCYIHAGLDESFGLSVVEAAYGGCPVVAVDEGGVRDTVEDGVTGYLVPPTAADLAQAVQRVLTRSDAGQGMGHAGRARVDRTYRWEDGAAEVVRILEALKSSR